MCGLFRPALLEDAMAFDTYVLHYRKYYNTPLEFVIVGKAWFFTSLEEAKAARTVSGDLVVNRRTGKVVNDAAWLWDWEKAKPDCYAQKAMRHDNP
jgi:hypothetical protein